MVWLTNLKDKDAQNHRQKGELSQIFAALEYSLKHFFTLLKPNKSCQ